MLRAFIIAMPNEKIFFGEWVNLKILNTSAKKETLKIVSSEFSIVQFLEFHSFKLFVFGNFETK